jgi:hypothetical protein
MYYGPGSEASAFFSRLGYPCPMNYNPGDFLLDLGIAFTKKALNK